MSFTRAEIVGIRRLKLWDNFFIVYTLYDDKDESQHQYISVASVVGWRGLNILCEDVADIARRTKEVKESMTSLALYTSIEPKTYGPPPPDETFTIKF
jgi:hypothetical protein